MKAFWSPTIPARKVDNAIEAEKLLRLSTLGRLCSAIDDTLCIIELESR
jgi:hypothetical protein